MDRLSRFHAWLLALVFIWTLVAAPVCIVSGAHSSGARDSHPVRENMAEHPCEDESEAGHACLCRHGRERHLAAASLDDNGKKPSRTFDFAGIELIFIGKVFIPEPNEALFRILFEECARDTGPPWLTHGSGARPLLS